MALIHDKLAEAKNFLGEMQRNYNFKKANKAREQAARLQSDLIKCRGKLNSCKIQFKSTIFAQSRNIARGRAAGLDTIMQEQILWDAAIGYLLVRDAEYAMSTISTYDSVAHAYEMLEKAMEQISNERSVKLSKLFSSNQTRERNVYGYITSSAAAEQKAAFLDSFFEELKRTGDIERCLKMAENPSHQRVERERMVGGNQNADLSGGGGSDVDQIMSRLHGRQTADESDDTAVDLTQAAYSDVHPPEI